MSKLWNATIEAHRREMRDAILDRTVALAAQHGPQSVTMSQIAEHTGIGHATLHKYFPDVNAILLTWHDRQISNHLELLTQVRDQHDSPAARLEAVLRAYAHIHQQRVRHHQHADHGQQLAAFLHQDEHIADAQQQVHTLIRELLADLATTGDLRDDTSHDELASYCLHALNSATALPSKAAVQRLVAVVMSGLRPQR